MIWALAVVALTGAADPRLELSEQQLRGQYDAALTGVEQHLTLAPAEANEMGFDYLRGHLLELADRPREAHEAFATAMSSSPTLTAYSRYRLALNQSKLGHPEVAAGLLATLLAGSPPAPLVPKATRLLVRSLAEGGDCRLLQGLDNWRLEGPDRRRLNVTAADCALEGGDRESASAILLQLLRTDIDDEPARAAAIRISTSLTEVDSGVEITTLLGRAFHRHREFARSTVYLSRGLEARRQEGLSGEDDEALYALARSHFWRGEYLLAVTRFGELAARSGDAEARARALYQQGRSYELYGAWEPAAASYGRAYLAEPAGRWADAAALSALRVDWRSGDETSALALYDLLGSKSSWRGMRARAALFLASSDLVRDRSDRAGRWLDDAAASPKTPTVELSFWRGRLAEAEGRGSSAVASYLSALREAPYHPLSQRARQRLGNEPLATAARASARGLGTSGRARDLLDAWLLADSPPAAAAAIDRLRALLERDGRSRLFINLEPLPASAWPLWEARLRQPEELLLALGIWGPASPVMLRHFPVSDPSLGLTGSRLLSLAGEYRRSVYIAEILSQRAPRGVPATLLADGLRRLLYPFPYRSLVEQQASRTDPFLLLSIMREESRFDPEAMSAASARGLTQFVLPTARRVALASGLGDLAADDLHRPEVSIALGGAYLEELAERFDGQVQQMVAAYNAGEDQARLWQSYCYSREPEEYFTKIGFPQTRAYLEKVLTSRAHYSELYSD